MEFNIFARQEDSLLYISAENAKGVLMNFCIRNMLGAQIISAKGGNSITIRRDDLNIVVFKHEESLVVQFINKTASPEGYVMQFDNPVNALNNDTFNVVGDYNVFVISERSTCIVSENQLNIYPNGTHTIITMYVPKDSLSAMSLSSLSLNAMSTGTYTVTNSDVLPEFSIAIYDDALRTTPRPMRLGVPVISTIPVYRVGLSESELQILEIGLGSEKRTMYFKIISNVVIPDDVEPVLNIYMPSGLDTISEPVPAEMTRQVSSDATRSVFYASHTFHTENTVDYVDGFVYLSVYMPMEINASLPIAMAVTETGDAIVDTYEDNPVFG